MSFAFLPDVVINLAESSAGSNPSGAAVVGHIDGDVTEKGHVEDEERAVRDVGNAVVVMAAAASLELEVERFGAEDGGLDVRVRTRGDNDQGFGRRGSVETSVSDVGAEGWGEAGTALRQNDVA